jgi:GNAT superfamily N-acetyltransferase
VIDIMPAHTPEMLEPVRLLFAEFADGGGAELTSKEFLTELVGLPGGYEPPGGRLIAAFEAAHLAGCAGLRDAGEGVAEIRRLYVREEYRNAHVERRLVSALLQEAQDAGYVRVWSDPATSMPKADEYLREAGFAQVPGESDKLMLEL